MRALVTGATGFLGAAAVARLRADGVTVRALVRSADARTEADERCVGDLRDVGSLEQAVAGVDWVIHAGARVATSGPWEEFEAVNVRATDALIRCAQAAGVRRMVHVSSLSVYGVPDDDAIISEDCEYDDGADERGFYARSKLAADRVAKAAMQAGAPLTIIRPGLLYGPGRNPPLARRAVALGPLRVLLARPGYLLPLSFVDNVADAIVLAARADAAVGRAYTIVDAHARQADYTRVFRRVSGGRWLAVYTPLSVLRTAVGVLERASALRGRRAPITRHQVERTLRSATFATRRAEDELGWRPRVGVDEGLRRTFAARKRAASLAATAAVQSPA